jgi:hypothetical protein
MAPSLRIDPDLAVFLFTVGKVLVAGPARLRRNLLFIPAEYDFEEIAPATLTEKQNEFFGRFDKKLAEMNYRPVCTYRVRNYGSNLIRMYVNPADRASCKVMVVETQVNVGGVPTSSNSSLVAFRTEFTDGKSLTTRNMRLKTVLDQPPEYIVQECPRLHDLQALKKRHDVRATTLGVRIAPEASSSRIFEFYQKEHRRFSEFQVERGTYLRAPGGYRVASKAHWRGIRDFLIPFSQRFSILRLTLAVLIAVGLPSLAYLRLVPLAMQRSDSSGLAPSVIGAVVLGTSYALAGVAVGLLLEMNGFLWGFLLTFVGVHLVTGWWSSVIPFGLIAGIASHASAKFRKRRQLVLHTSRAL